MWEEVIWFFKDYAESILAICAIVLTIQQSWAVRKHNKLSVRPMLSLFTHRNYSPGIVDVRSVLTNSGLGPAYIKSFEYLVDEIPIVASNADQAIAEIQSRTPVPILDWSLALLRPKHVIAKESSQELFSLQLVNCEALTEAEMERLQLLILYESAYGEVFTYDSRQHAPI